ncbi:hypothetical protein RZS08_16730, partial [Arthrospira platensis SPKY1]|nr:hypothetical protein [Arthrospira platensis SPKY1]
DMAGFGGAQQFGHRAGIQRLPGGLPGRPVVPQRGLAQAVGAVGCGSNGLGHLTGTGTVHPETIDWQQARGLAGIVDGQGVEQHLGFALQALQQALALRVFGRIGEPGADRPAADPVQTGAGQAAQRLT